MYYNKHSDWIILYAELTLASDDRGELSETDSPQ